MCILLTPIPFILFFHRGTAPTMMWHIVRREAGSTEHLSWEGVIMLPLKWILFWNTKHHNHSTDQPSHFGVPRANRTTGCWLLLCDLSVWKHLGQGEIYGKGANHAVEWDVWKTGFYYTKGKIDIRWWDRSWRYWSNVLKFDLFLIITAGLISL